MAPPSIDETALIDSLDDEWRSPAQIRTRLGLQIWSTRIATALERLANRDQIERRSQETPVRKRNGGNLTIRYYRRRSPQDWALVGDRRCTREHSFPPLPTLRRRCLGLMPMA